MKRVYFDSIFIYIFAALQRCCGHWVAVVHNIHYSPNESEEDFSEYAINARVARY